MLLTWAETACEGSNLPTREKACYHLMTLFALVLTTVGSLKDTQFQGPSHHQAPTLSLPSITCTPPNPCIHRHLL